MPGVIVPNINIPMLTNDDWTNLLTKVFMVGRGKENITLTEWTTTSVSSPLIEKHSFIEIDGTFIIFNSNTAFQKENDAISIGNVYMMIDITNNIVIPYFTNTMPVWDAQRNGFYRSGDKYKRYLRFTMVWDGVNWKSKKEFINNNLNFYIYPGGQS